MSLCGDYNFLVFADAFYLFGQAFTADGHGFAFALKYSYLGLFFFISWPSW
ncbi:hypothetical protein JGUZn3_13070 [Entomobacter blattae]|uniref:Uncharacterized protein n=1 Tax=Entomobacter blattae TaxID=2762277 RepID=A0A7H1NRX3_9PROT|nr:hypothetical protein JGUZn3_13070 [Entomobacter blattae]